MKKETEKKKLYAYVDESGQDTKGVVFVVSVLILGGEKDVLQEELERIEIESGKKNMKWNKSHHESRKAYIEGILKMKSLKGKMFFEKFSDTKKYIQLTSFATAKAILKKSGSDDYKVTVFVDGFKKREIEVFSRGLRDLRIKTRKIRGVRKDENNVFIRLVDALCGLVRDKDGGNKWSDEVTKRLIKDRYIFEL